MNHLDLDHIRFSYCARVQILFSIGFHCTLHCIIFSKYQPSNSVKFKAEFRDFVREVLIQFFCLLLYLAAILYADRQSHLDHSTHV